MIEDAKIRAALLDRFHFPPHALEMEEYEFGDEVGVTLLSDGGRLRAKVKATGKDEAQITEELSSVIERDWFEPETP